MDASFKILIWPPRSDFSVNFFKEKVNPLRLQDLIKLAGIQLESLFFLNFTGFSQQDEAGAALSISENRLELFSIL